MPKEKPFHGKNISSKSIGAKNNDWKDYELQILKVFREKYPSYLVLDNQRIKGVHSKASRQIDVVVYLRNDKKIKYAIECKNLNKIVTVPILDSFYGKLHDIDVQKGIIVTTKGFSQATKNYAEKKNIILEKINYEYLKDFYYMPPNDVPDVFVKAVRYVTPLCSECKVRILYEIGEVYGMAESEPIFCPKCKTKLYETRSDANHRVIKMFWNKRLPAKRIESVIAKHIFATQGEWQSNELFLSLVKFPGKESCDLCKYEFCEKPPTHMKLDYNGRKICSECMMSKRTLLIDYGYL